MRVFVTGARGLLGVEVCSQLRVAGHEVLDFGSEFDISNPEHTARIAVEDFGKLDWLVNCAAFTGVDLAESEAQRAYEVNTLGPGYLSTACNIAMVKILHVSTDFVFDGESERPYTEDDPPNPLGVYGKTKLAGEKALAGNHRAVIVRTSWLFGPRGKCFPRSILAAFDAGKPLRVVADQFGTPTYTPFLAERLAEMIALDPFPGTYHLAGGDVVSWGEFAGRAVAACRGKSEAVSPITTDEWPTAAVRPRFSALSSDRVLALGVSPMPPLESALGEFCRSGL